MHGLPILLGSMFWVFLRLEKKKRTPCMCTIVVSLGYVNRHGKRKLRVWVCLFCREESFGVMETERKALQTSGRGGGRPCKDAIAGYF